MDFRVLAVGDVVGNPGLEQIRRNLRQMKRQYHADFAVVNGENAAVVGITPNQADSILDAGADIVTMGNHTWSKREIVPYMDDCPWIIRPANYAPQVPGRGWQVVQTAAGDVAVIDLIGRCNMDAEATSEKLAMGYMLDGRVSAVWGTHTHVPTADARVLPKGTGYVTDLGMTGPRDSVLGIRPELSIAKFRGDLPERYRWAEGASKIEAVLFTIDSETRKCRKAERVDKWD